MFQIFVVIFVHLKVFFLIFMLCSEVGLFVRSFVQMFWMSGLLVCVILYQPVKLDVVECTIVLCHQILLNDTSI
jgi:cytochrome c oxidase subunit IV